LRAEVASLSRELANLELERDGGKWSEGGSPPLGLSIALPGAVSRSPHLLRGMRPPMTLLERFAHVKIEVGLDPTLNLVQTAEAACELLGIQPDANEEHALRLPEVLLDLETALGLGPPTVDLSESSRSPAQRARQSRQRAQYDADPHERHFGLEHNSYDTCHTPTG